MVMGKQEDLRCSLMEEGPQRPPAVAAAEGNDDDEASRRWRHYAWRDAIRGFCVGTGLAMVLFILTIKLPCENSTEAGMLVGFVLLVALAASGCGFILTGDWHQIPY